MAILQFSCTSPAEHSNPLDPKSPVFSANGAINGTVTSYYQPFRPLANVEVRLSPQPLLAFTDEKGEFSFRDLPPRDYEIAARHPGYAAGTLAVSVPQRQSVTATIRLNGLPKVDSVVIVTARVASQPDSIIFFLEVAVTASDPDGANDVKRLTIMASDFAFSDTLAPVGRTGVWQRRFRSDELPSVPLPAWSGHALHVSAEDFLRQQTTAGPFFIARVIQEVPETIAPVADSLVTRTPLRFSWRNNPVAYPHTHEVEIFRINAGFPSFFAAIRRITAGNNNAVYPGSLLPPSGQYFWTVKIVDEFGNWSRSKEAAFRVQRP
ncbi:MAG: carboxypeptidase-like regulatory domain-containing protein [bacterium]